ncbi:MAG: hypothetical protein Tsb0027_03030 [Wenzhouxiangellaceae bacterium]
MTDQSAQQPAASTSLDSLSQRAFALFNAAMERAAGERDDWLRDRCGHDQALLHEVQRLVQAERDSSGFLETTPLWQAQRDDSGEQVGAFVLVRMLAQGGMGTVYLGQRNDGTYAQQVAIKLFNPRIFSGATRERFAAERNILAALEHPGIARIIDGGETADGVPFVVMELVQGETIARYCEQQQLELTDRLHLILKLCDALEHAHRCGVVHRDIKAGNVLVTDQGEPKLIDFGIAKILPADDDAAADNGTEDSANQTTALMTPEYASPEQIRGAAASPVSDIYSLGVLMYELLTGSRPHHLAGLSPAAMERAVCGTVPLDPSAAVARNKAAPPSGLGLSRPLQKRLRGDLDRIVMTALRLQPAQRYASAAALASDIRRYLSGQPVAARGASRLYRAGKFVQRHRPVVLVTVAAFALLLTALLQLAMQVQETRQQRDIAVAEAQKAVLARDFLTSMIARADPFERVDAPTLAGALRQSIADIDQRFANQPELEADMRYAVGYALQNLGEVELARTQLQRALALRREQQQPVRLAEAHDGMAIVCWWESDFSCAETHFVAALDALQLADAGSAEALAVLINVHANRSAMRIDQGDYSGSLDSARSALQLAQTHDFDDAETLAAIWLNLATALEGTGQDDAALEAFQQALSLQQALTGKWHPSYAVILNNLALYRYKLGQYRAAAAALQESVQIRRQTLGDAHPQTATALFNLARVLIETGDLNAAEQAASEALQVARSGYADNHPRIGKAHEALALVYRAQMRNDLALQHAVKAEAIYAAANEVDPAWIESIADLLHQLKAGAECKQAQPSLVCAE